MLKFIFKGLVNGELLGKCGCPQNHFGIYEETRQAPSTGVNDKLMIIVKLKLGIDMKKRSG